MSNPTASWERVADRFYQRIHLYDAIFDPDLELENYTVKGAPCGGAIVLYRDESKVSSYRTSAGIKSSLDIYSCSGKLIKKIDWDKGSIRGLGWSIDEQLLVVTDDGNVRCYYGLQGDFTQFSLGHGAEEVGVKECRFWSTGFVALLSNNHLVAVPQYTDPRPKLLALVPEDALIHSWTIIPPSKTLSRSVEVLLAIGETIFVVDSTECEDRLLQNGPFKHISISPNGHFTALYSEDGKIWVITSDFQEKKSEYESRAKTVPKDVIWCGNNAVLLAWEDEIHLVGPNGASLKYFYDSWIHLLPDVDGVRIVTNDLCEFVRKVPDELEEVFRLGSKAPAAILLDAVDQLEKESPKADDNIKLIKPDLDEAIDVCIRAAGQEYDLNWQKKLLRAASFGKSVLDLYNSDEFVSMCETLRVLNGARDYRVGLSMTYEEYLHLTPSKLIQRLMDRREYLLAVRTAEYLRLSTDRIFVHWASQKVRHSELDDETICSGIVDRLSKKRGVSFEVIARAAYDEGRAPLATQLLDYEPRAGKQVLLLLDMKEDEIALDKALESGDTDLILFVLLRCKNTLPLATFFRLLSTRPIASALVEASAVSNDSALLKDLYYQDDRPLDSSRLIYSSALDQTTNQLAIDKLKVATRTLTDAKDPAATQHQKSMAETQHLLRAQDGLSTELDSSYRGLSLHATLNQLVRSGYSKRAQKLQSDFSVGEKTYAWIRLRALVAARNWGEVEELSKARKSSIGWEPYFNEVLGAGNTRLAAAFVPKCSTLSPQERSQMWVKCGLIGDAGKELHKVKDLKGLEDLRSKAKDSTMQVEVERLISQLKPKG